MYGSILLTSLCGQVAIPCFTSQKVALPFVDDSNPDRRKSPWQSLQTPVAGVDLAAEMRSVLSEVAVKPCPFAKMSGMPRDTQEMLPSGKLT